MGRLKGRALPSRLTAVPSRLRPAAPSNEKERLRQRDKSKPYSKWKKTARWQKLRLAILKRDSWTCQKTGVSLVGKYPAPTSPVADHIIPHRGDPDLFWDPANLQAVSKKYHDTTKQSLEARGLA